jgi:hypothetical protein
MIPFGLFNAPSTFQSLMIIIFQHFLYHFVLDFFYNILVLNKTYHSHVTHVDHVLQFLVNNQIFL